eukprot:jgi/Tetstr1/430713/TSEL_020505.t1
MAARPTATAVRRRHISGPSEPEPAAAATLVEEDAEGRTQVFLFTSPPPPDFYCPLSGKLLAEPVLTPYGHTFSKEPLLAHVRATGQCPVTQKPLSESQLKPNLLARTMVEELEVRCPYGVRLGAAGWEADPDGCHDTFKLGLRRAKLQACRYRPVRCPYGGRRCGPIPRLDLPLHLSEECAHLHERAGGRGDGDTPGGSDTLEVLTILLAWGLLLFGFYQTHFFGRLMREASPFLTLLLGIPVTLVFVAILAEYCINRGPLSPASDESEEEEEEEDR